MTKKTFHDVATFFIKRLTAGSFSRGFHAETRCCHATVRRFIAFWNDGQTQRKSRLMHETLRRDRKASRGCNG